MKVEEVPQDLKYYKGSVVRDANYALDEENHFQLVQSDGWAPKNDALDLVLEEYNDKEVRSKMKLQVPEAYHGFELDLSLRPSAHCENGTTSMLLRYYGIDLSEPMIFGLASGLFFAHIPFVKMTGMPMTTFRSFPGVLFKRVTKQLGIETGSSRFLIKDHAMQQLDKLLLEEKRPVGVVVGIYYLPYYPPEYRFPFNGHNICVIGKNDQTNEYSVLDPNTTQKITISYDDLRKVRFSPGTYPLMGQMYWIKSVPEKIPDLKPIVLKAIHKTCWLMVKEPSWVIFAGTRGIDYLSNRMRKWEKKKGAHGAQMNLVHVIRMLEEVGTGGAGYRFIYSAFLQEAAEKTGLTVLNDYSMRLSEIGDQWRDFAFKASRVYKKRSNETYTYDYLADLLHAIGEKEKQFFIDLDNEVQNL
ncbi:MAG: BtrH N-terminal domain-containing protein [Prevotella sp.]|nr:BtrH N-terminal domain-containing protein [Prevotella sp.]